MEPTNYYLAIIEDKSVILDSLMEYFSSSRHFHVLIAGSAEHFRDNWREQHIDLLLCDMGLPGGLGIELAWNVKRKSPTTQVVMFTVFDDTDTVFRALCAGASDYLLKNTPLPQVEERLLEVLAGGSGMGPQVARMVLAHFGVHADQAMELDGERLAPHELEIVSMLQQGNSHKQVAEALSTGVETVKSHIRNVYGKLQVNSRGGMAERYKRL